MYLKLALEPETVAGVLVLRSPRIRPFFLSLVLAGCASPPSADSSSPALVSAPSAEAVDAPTNRVELLEFFEAADREVVERSPLALGRRGSSELNDRWDDVSDAFTIETVAIRRRHLARLDGLLGDNALSASDALDVQLFRHEWSTAIASAAYRFHAYPLNQMRGAHADAITHLTNNHPIASDADAEAYLARLRALPAYLEQLSANVIEQHRREIVAPAFTFAMAAEVAERIASGRPIDNGPDLNVLFADFERKIAGRGLPATETQDWIRRSHRILVDIVAPAYRRFAVAQRSYERLAQIHGVWALPDGDAYYRHELRRYTTTDMTPDQVHELGLSEVARLHGEIGAVMQTVGFSGNLREFFEFTLTDPQFYYPPDDAGRAAAIADATALVNDVKTRVDALFRTTPRADVVVRAVEPYRERSAGDAFYRRGSPDGTRPGIYYLNTYDLSGLPRWQMPALAYHEAIPGHHFQRSIGQEMTGIPTFRRFVRYEAYTEGWGLYAERLAKELGYYEDPYDEYGRLTMELLRACRLVVDTGLHARRWGAEQAVAYLRENMPTTESRARKAVYRYLVQPGQATAYTIGSLTIARLRHEAESALGSQFDVRAFHDVVLRNSQVPLFVLEQLVHQWIDTQSTSDVPGATMTVPVSVSAVRP